MSRRLPKLRPLTTFALLLVAVGILLPMAPDGPSAPGAAPTAAPTAGRLEPSPTPAPAGVASAPAGAPSVPESPTAAPPKQGSTATTAPRATAGATQSSPAPTREAGRSTQRVVLGYYVPYDATSWASFHARAAGLDYVAAQWVTVDACGGIGSRDDRTLIAYAAEQGVKVLPSLLTSSGWLNHRLLADPATTDRFLNEIVSYVVEMGYPGFDLDLEGIDAGDRDAYSAFVARLADALHQRGKILTLAIPAKTSDVRTGWAGPYDYAALGRHADLILLMTYDHSWASGPPGSIAPQEWVDRVAAYAVSQMPPGKVLLGLAFYGYDWNTTLGGRARSLIYSQAVALARQHGARIITDVATASATFSYTARPGDTVPPPPSLPTLRHDIAVRTPGPCPVQAPTQIPRPAPTPGPSPTPPPLQEHVVWLEDATSVAARLEVARRHGVAGVGAWRLGQEDPEVWPHLAAYRSAASSTGPPGSQGR